MAKKKKGSSETKSNGKATRAVLVLSGYSDSDMKFYRDYKERLGEGVNLSVCRRIEDLSEKEIKDINNGAIQVHYQSSLQQTRGGLKPKK
jgi:hypothetical protein